MSEKLRVQCSICGSTDLTLSCPDTYYCNKCNSFVAPAIDGSVFVLQMINGKKSDKDYSLPRIGVAAMMALPGVTSGWSEHISSIDQALQEFYPECDPNGST